MKDSNKTKLKKEHDAYVKKLEEFECPICHEIGTIHDDRCSNCGEDFKKYIIHIDKKETIQTKTAKVLIIDEQIETFRAFKYVSSPDSVEKIILPDSVTKIASHAFSYYKNIKTYFIPKNVKDIHSMAFVFQHGIAAFSSYYVQEGVEVDPLNKTFDSRYNCHGLIRSKDNVYLKGFNNSNIPEGIVKLANGCFWRTTKLELAIIPNTVKQIGSYAFSNSAGLKTIFLPDGLETLDLTIIPDSLTKLIIPKSVKKLAGFLVKDPNDIVFYYEGEEIPSQFNEYIKGLSFYVYSKERKCDGLHWRYLNNEPTLYVRPASEKNDITIVQFELVMENSSAIPIDPKCIRFLSLEDVEESVVLTSRCNECDASINKHAKEVAMVIDKKAMNYLNVKGQDNITIRNDFAEIIDGSNIAIISFVGRNSLGAFEYDYYVDYLEDENDCCTNRYQHNYQDEEGNLYITIGKKGFNHHFPNINRKKVK